MVDDQHQSGRPFRAAPAGVSVFLAVVLAAFPGCGSSPLPSFTPSQRLTADDFRQPTAEGTHEPTPIPAYRREQPRAPRVEIRSLTEEQARAGVPGVDGRLDNTPTPPSTPPPADNGQRQPRDTTPLPAASHQAIDPNDLILVDAKVGDLNGLPVLARTWLEPMGARLRAESMTKGMTRDKWRNFAAQEINARLGGDLRDELFLAEARSTLTTQQKAGLRVFLSRFEKDVIRSNYGSETRANQTLRSTAGMGLEEAKRQREKDLLIRTQMQKMIWDRVQVSWRDLQLEYDRNHDKYNPPPQAIFRRIRVRSDDLETVEAFTNALESTPFPVVAEDDRNGTKDPAVREIHDGYEHTEFFGLDELQEAAASLSPGEWAGPIDTGIFTYWLYLDRIESESHSLYEVQQELRQQITDIRREEEARRYLLRLFERAGITGLDQLVYRLVVIAEQWYYEGEAG